MQYLLSKEEIDEFKSEKKIDERVNVVLRAIVAVIEKHESNNTMVDPMNHKVSKQFILDMRKAVGAGYEP